MGDLSPHFDRAEFRCRHCGELPNLSALDVLVAGLERLRAKAYPGGLPILSGYRCADYNRLMPTAAPRSQHLHAAAADVPLVAPLAVVARLRVFSGIGWQKSGTQRLVRHVDVRHASGSNPTGGTTVKPTTWEYLADGSRR